MGYSMNQFLSDYLFFSSQFNSEHQAAYNDLKETLSDINNIPDDDFDAARDVYLNTTGQGFQNAIDAVLSQPDVANNTAAHNLWQEFQGSPVCPAIVGAIAANYVCDREHTQEFIELGNEEASKRTDELAKGAIMTVLEPPISPGMPKAPGNNALIILCNGIVNWDDIKSGVAVIKGWFSDLYTSAQQFLRTVFADPLVLDLDGDGIETLSVKSGIPIYFDFNSDGTKTNTGWISPDDAYLVFDRNDNGVIDDASELFSDYTPLYAGGRASDGFVALAQEDTNADGVVNHLDANWNNLKIWQDINSDGISQENELRTMEEAGIIGINTARANTSQTFANGNAIRGMGTYMKDDGTIGQMGDVYYAVDTVNQQFTNPIPVSPEVEALPNVQGMGLVRDLQQAAELSPVLQYLLTQYSQASTRQEQMAIIDQLLYAWADTSGMAATMESLPDEYLRRAA